MTELIEQLGQPPESAEGLKGAGDLLVGGAALQAWGERLQRETVAYEAALDDYLKGGRPEVPDSAREPDLFGWTQAAEHLALLALDHEVVGSDVEATPGDLNAETARRSQLLERFDVVRLELLGRLEHTAPEQPARKGLWVEVSCEADTDRVDIHWDVSDLEHEGDWGDSGTIEIGEAGSHIAVKGGAERLRAVLPCSRGADEGAARGEADGGEALDEDEVATLEPGAEVLLAIVGRCIKGFVTERVQPGDIYGRHKEVFRMSYPSRYTISFESDPDNSGTLRVRMPYVFGRGEVSWTEGEDAVQGGVKRGTKDASDIAGYGRLSISLEETAVLIDLLGKVPVVVLGDADA
jgi:hypothetical protein